MYTFKEFITEVTLKDWKARGFGNPGPRAKYQIGQYVVIGGDDRWSIYQPQRSQQYIGQTGKVVAYKQVPGSYTKYAIEFPNGDVEAFHSHYVYGPFATQQIADKYVKKGTKKYTPKIDPKDVAGSSGGVMESKPAIENLAKQTLTAKPFGLVWLDTPLQFKDNKYVTTIFATAPLSKYGFGKTSDHHDNIKNSSVQLRKYLEQNICFFRTNNIVTGKLINEGCHNLTNTHYGGTLSPYVLNMPYFSLYRLNDHECIVDFTDKKQVQKALKNKNAAGARIRFFAITASTFKNVQPLVDKFNLTINLAHGNFDLQALFNEVFNVKGNTIPQTIWANAKTIDQFQNYSLQSGNSLILREDDLTKIKKTPPGMTQVVLSAPGKKNIQIPDFSFLADTVKELIIQQYVIDSFNNAPASLKILDMRYCTINSFKGLPDEMDYIDINAGTIRNFVGFPKKFDGDIDISGKVLSGNFRGGEDTVIAGHLQIYNLENLKSLQGIPAAKGYGLPDNFTEKQARKEVKDRGFIKKLEPEVKDAFEDILKNL